MSTTSTGNTGSTNPLLYIVILAFGIAAPFVMPAYIQQVSFLWIFILFALTWDLQGGQMGYNSFGNIVFFGTGMYVSASTQVALYFDLGAWNESGGENTFIHATDEYFIGLAAGLVLSGIVAAALAAFLGSGILGLRGQYFAICTLGLSVAAGEIAAGIDLIGAGSGMSTPVWPDAADSVIERGTFFYILCFMLAVATFIACKYLYSGRFGMVLNAIRDDEDKAEAMGIHTTRYKALSWTISAFFLGISGAIMGNIIGFIDPVDVAFTGATFGVWMVLMAILGGKGTLWGPVLGAAIFHIMQELFWTYFLGWQRVALGLLIILIVVFLPQGILGSLREHFPEWFGHRLEPVAVEDEK
ncbi:MAG: branched-chain amino acid ABC transporter permease [SAR324 cluster bacterium]|nr:branched-chain amino acid ABC transporter permease [SAR324 cluster bacterium]MBL7035267.1 branched-chain amino acid ABC transporter permease [SAR324 cluster bacterium]